MLKIVNVPLIFITFLILFSVHHNQFAKTSINDIYFILLMVQLLGYRAMHSSIKNPTYSSRFSWNRKPIPFFWLPQAMELIASLFTWKFSYMPRFPLSFWVAMSVCKMKDKVWISCLFICLMWSEYTIPFLIHGIYWKYIPSDR